MYTVLANTASLDIARVGLEVMFKTIVTPGGVACGPQDPFMCVCRVETEWQRLFLSQTLRVMGSS